MQEEYRDRSGGKGSRSAGRGAGGTETIEAGVIDQKAEEDS
jgi:hypothetical protein